MQFPADPYLKDGDFVVDDIWDSGKPPRQYVIGLLK